MENNQNPEQIKYLQDRIRNLLNKRNAILLAHNYQRPEIQDIADLCGDSLELSIKASQTDADVIAFCGVHFMAETASILCPDKKVLLPAPDAGCPMANMISKKDLIKKKQESDAIVITYVNTTAEVKAESDICCTSANAVKVVNSLDRHSKIFMIPDRNLAQYTKKISGMDIQYWNGYCPVHDNLTLEQVRATRDRHPDAIFLAHPECRPEILDEADEIKSTSGIIAYTIESDSDKFIIGTEIGILHPLQKASPDKLFIPASPQMVCRDMKKTGLEDVIRALENLEPEVKVPHQIGIKAKNAVDKMLAIPG